MATLWSGGRALDGALAGASSGRHDTVLALAGVGWLAGVIALAVPAVVSLTAARTIVPAATPVATVTWIGGADATDGALFLAIAVMAGLVVLSAELGRVFVQASAYGDEERHVLRAPTAYLAAAVLAWCVVAAGAIAGGALLAASRWVVGAPVAAVALASGAWAWPRWHRLTRRWLVVVPVGVVVHDHLVLGETLMIRRQELRSLRLAPAGTEAADLTGPAAGHAIEILTHEPVTAIFASTPHEPRGRTIHLTGCLVAPTRPGRALRSVGDRRMPVG